MIEFVGWGYGGALLRRRLGWNDIIEIDVFSDGHHLARIHRTAFKFSGVAAENLFDRIGFDDGERKIFLRKGQIEQIGWGKNLSDDWRVEGEETLYCFRAKTDDLSVCEYDITASAGLSDYEPNPGINYCFGFDMAQHRCEVGLAIEWIDVTGKTIRRDEVWRTKGPQGGRNAANYQPCDVMGVCPAGTQRLSLVVLQSAPTEDPDCYVFFRRPRFVVKGSIGGEAAGKLHLFDISDPGEYAILPIGDILARAKGPLQIFHGASYLDIPEPPEPPASLMPQAQLIQNNGFLDVLIDAGDHDKTFDVNAYIVVDGDLLSFFTLHKHAGAYRASISLPTRLLDGQYHWIEVRGGHFGETLHASWCSLPAFSTPPSVIQEHTPRIDNPAILPMADQRYAALQATIARLSRMEQVDATILSEVAQCHAYVLKGLRSEHDKLPPRKILTSADPVFSIVIPVHNKINLTYFCLCSINYTCAGLPFEIIIVDDGSGDDTQSIADWIDGIRVIRHDQSHGFVGACNAGAMAARGSHIIFLNNDTEVVGRWLEELHAPFKLYERVGLTGARLVYPDGKLQEAGGGVWGNGQPWNVGRGGNPADPTYNYTRQVDYVSGAALMIERRLWQQVRGFSKEFTPAYYEDTDLAFKVRDAGYKTVYAAKATVIHYEGMSNGTNTNGEGLKRFQKINQPKFEQKWRGVYQLHSPEGVRPDLEKDRGIVGRALVLDHQPPRFDRDAGSHAISQEMRIMQALGYKVTLAPGNCAHLGYYTDVYQRAGVEQVYAPFYSSLRDVIERRGSEFDLIYIHRYTTAEGLIDTIRNHAPQAKILLNCADLHFLRELRAARQLGSRAAFQHALEQRDRELETLVQVDCILTYSDVEKTVIESFLGFDANVQLLPWVVDSIPGNDYRNRDGIAFLGSWDHPPNREAVIHFLKEYWPAVRDAHPDMKLYIAGSGFERLTLPEPDPQVEIVGWVEDAQAFLGACRLMIAPLLSGAGVKGKVFDALSSGTPCVLSKVAAEGISPSAAAALIAQTPDDWKEQIRKLYDDAVLWKRASQQAIEFIDQQHSVEIAISRFTEIFQSTGLYLQENAQVQSLWTRENFREIARILS